MAKADDLRRREGGVWAAMEKARVESNQGRRAIATSAAQLKLNCGRGAASETRMSDWKDVEPGRLIMSTPTFIVFIDDVGDIDWRVSNFEWKAIDPIALNGVINRAAALEAIPWNGLDERFNTASKRLIAETIARVLDGDPQSGITMLTEVTKQLELRSNEVSRRWYLASCYAAVTPFLLFGAVLWMVRQQALETLGPTAFWFLIAAFGGAMEACSRLLLVRAS